MILLFEGRVLPLNGLIVLIFKANIYLEEKNPEHAFVLYTKLIT